MKLSTRYGIAGIAALATLTGVQWLREMKLPHDEVSDYLLGVLPNFCAALAITFVLLSILADQLKLNGTPAARRWFLFSAAVAGVGLLGWEAFQRTSDNFVFDYNDVGATLVGLVLSYFVFRLVTPHTTEHSMP